MAAPGMPGFGILRREKDRTSTKIDMFDLNLDKLAHPATQFVNDLEHQFVLVVVNRIEKLLEFIDRQVSDDFPEPFVSFLTSGMFLLISLDKMSVAFHRNVNVKSSLYIKTALCRKSERHQKAKDLSNIKS